MTEPLGTPAPSLARTAWLVVVLLIPVALLNYLDRQMLAAMKTSMMGDLPDIHDDRRWGLMLASFKWVYAGLSPIGGYIADRLSRRYTITLSLFCWSVVTWLTGHVTTAGQLTATRAAMGISEAFYIPAALALITDYHVGRTRSRAVGLHQMGIYAGIILGGFSGYAAENPHLGWRWAFSWCGLIGAVYAVPLFLLLRDIPRPAERALSPSPLAAVARLFENPNYILLVLYFTLPAMAGWIVKDWMPSILQKSFGLGQGAAGQLAVIYVHPASLVGVVLGGFLADSWTRSTARGRIYISAIGVSLFMPALFGIGNAGSVVTAALWLTVFGVGWGFFDCNNMPILCQVARPELRATGYGFMNLVSTSFGGVADWLYGALKDEHWNDNAIFGVFSTVAMLSIALVLMIRPQQSSPSPVVAT